MDRRMIANLQSIKTAVEEQSKKALPTVDLWLLVSSGLVLCDCGGEFGCLAPVANKALNVTEPNEGVTWKMIPFLGGLFLDKVG